MNADSRIHLLPQTELLLSLHATIRDKNVSHDDFVFHSRRIFRQLIDAATNLLPYHPHTVTTPVGDSYDGLKLACSLCAVSIVRAGESMESELDATFRGISIGKILIQRNKRTHLPKLLYVNLPADISQRNVLILDPMLATGGSALEAILVLMRAGVHEEQMVFVNVLASPQGLDRITKAHPKLSIVTSSIERALNDQAYMLPGIGDFGDRYFGTTQRH